MIIRGGHNIDPASIEDVALNFPGVGLAAAVGRPDPYAGETPILFVAPAAGQTIDEAALADHMRAGVSEAPARPRTIVVIGDMPVTPVGKIFKPRLREIAAEYAARELLALLARCRDRAASRSRRERPCAARQGSGVRSGSRACGTR